MSNLTIKNETAENVLVHMSAYCMCDPKDNTEDVVPKNTVKTLTSRYDTDGCCTTCHFHDSEVWYGFSINNIEIANAHYWKSGGFFHDLNAINPPGSPTAHFDDKFSSSVYYTTLTICPVDKPTCANI